MEDENGKLSESENERNLSGFSSDDDDSPFDDKMAQDIFDDWVVSLPLTKDARWRLCKVKLNCVQEHSMPLSISGYAGQIDLVYQKSHVMNLH